MPSPAWSLASLSASVRQTDWLSSAPPQEWEKQHLQLVHYRRIQTETAETRPAREQGRPSSETKAPKKVTGLTRERSEPIERAGLGFDGLSPHMRPEPCRRARPNCA